jgi:DNA primase
VLVPKIDTRKSLEAATAEYHLDLLKDDEALRYLESRGITKEVASYFRLGVVRAPWTGHENYVGRLSFPYLTPTGVVSVRFRTIGDPGERAKFLSLPGDEARLYNTRALLKAREVYICEGETDTIAAYSAGVSAVGAPGARSWSKNARVFSRVFANRQVYVLADNDDAGEGMEFAQDVYRSLGGCGIIRMPEGYDVSKLVSGYGTEALRELIRSGK